MKLRSLASMLLIVAVVAAACSDAGPTGDDRLQVVVTTSILGDLVRNITGSDADVEILIPTGTDPHEFQPSARQVASIVSADLVVSNGLGLEEGLTDALTTATEDGAVVVAIAELLDPLPFSGADEEGLDPHVWLDTQRMADAARIVAARLTVIDDRTDWTARAEAYAGELDSTDAAITEILSTVPAERRKLVTNHDALGYFAARYQFTVIGTVVPGGTSLGEPSSEDLADLVATILREDVPAIFAETTEPTVLAEAIAAEVGDIAVVELFTGSLGGPGSGAETLVGMLTTNARRIADALS